MEMRMKLGLIVLGSLMAISAGPSFAGSAEAGKAKAAVCAGCHGPEGISFSPDIPNLAGQKEAYLAKAIRDYKSGARKNPMMSSMVGNLSDEDINDLAAYFAGLK